MFNINCTNSSLYSSTATGLHCNVSFILIDFWFANKFEVVSKRGFNYNPSFVRLSNTYLKAEISTTAKLVQHSRRLYSWKMVFCRQALFGKAEMNKKMKTLQEQTKMREQLGALSVTPHHC